MTLPQLNTSPGNEGVIYCISWAPADLNCIVASTSKHAIFVWDIGRGKIAKRFLEVNELRSCFEMFHVRI